MDIDPTRIFFDTAALSTLASCLIPIFQQVKGTEIPRIEYVQDGEAEPSVKVSKRSVRERGWYIFCCAVLGFLTGSTLTLYWLGFNQTPNNYQQMFWALVCGFLSPQIWAYIQKVDLSGLKKYLFKKDE